MLRYATSIIVDFSSLLTTILQFDIGERVWLVNKDGTREGPFLVGQMMSETEVRLYHPGGAEFGTDHPISVLDLEGESGHDPRVSRELTYGASGPKRRFSAASASSPVLSPTASSSSSLPSEEEYVSAVAIDLAKSMPQIRLDTMQWDDLLSSLPTMLEIFALKLGYLTSSPDTLLQLTVMSFIHTRRQ